MPLSGEEYEAVVCEVVRGLRENPGMRGYVMGDGRRNRIAGESGYSHQIDISLEGDKELFLLELKHYAKRVGVAQVLPLAARIVDIAAAKKGKRVFASLISKDKASRNAVTLGKFFHIKIDIVESVYVYGLRFDRQQFFGVAEILSTAEDCRAVVTKWPISGT